MIQNEGSTPASPESTTRPFVAIERWLGLVSALLLLLWLSLWYFELRSASHGTRGEKLGTITFKYKRAQRRTENQAVFLDVQQQDNVFENDWVRTSSESEATVTFSDGSKLVLDALSMVVLQKRGEQTEIRLERGSIRAASTKGGRVRLLTASGSVEARGESKLTLKDAGQAILDVLSGSAIFKHGSGELSVAAAQRAELGPTPKKLEAAIALLEPDDGARFFPTEATQAVKFDWRSQTSGQLLLEISRDPSMNQLTRSIDAPQPKTAFSFEPGFYYWRMRSIAANGSVSAVRKFWVLETPAVNLLQPAPQDKISYSQKEPLVAHRWSQYPFAKSYQLEIAKDLDFSQLVHRKVLSKPSFVAQMTEGTYFWRVIATSDQVGASRTSKTASYRVAKIAELARPTLMRPRPDEHLPLAEARKRGIFLRWQLSPEFKNTRVLVARSATLTSPDFTASAQHNFSTWSPVEAPGRYYWQVHATDPKGTQVTSDIGHFTVGEEPVTESKLAAEPKTMARTHQVVRAKPRGNHQRVVPKPEPAVKEEQPPTTAVIIEKVQSAPESAPLPRFPRPQQDVDMTTSKTLRFEWSKVVGAAVYHLRVFRVFPDRQQKIYEYSTREQFFSLRDLSKLGVGTFGWSIAAEGPDGTLGSDTVYNFRITVRAPEAPKVTSPKKQVLPTRQ